MKSTGEGAHVRCGYRRRRGRILAVAGASRVVAGVWSALEEGLEGDDLLDRLRLVPGRSPHACTEPARAGQPPEIPKS